jgi:DNA polymerase I
MLRKLIDEHRPDYMAVVFDAPGKTFRDDLYPEYKANRPPMPEDCGSRSHPCRRSSAPWGCRCW